MKKSTLLDEVTPPLEKEDFSEAFHQIIFATINNLHCEGVENIDYIAIDNFLSKYEKHYHIFNTNNGMDYLAEAVEYSSLTNFQYNYMRLKKFSMLREYEADGVDVSDIYNDMIISPSKQEEMQQNFDKMSLQDIADEIDKKSIRIKDKFLSGSDNQGQQAGVGLKELKERLKLEPEIGSPLCSGIFNTIFRGARLRKFYLRSAPTGLGCYCLLV